MAINSSHGSRVWGSIALGKVSEITLDVNDELTFNVDETPISITIDASSYNTNINLHTSQLVDEINVKLSAIDAPVIAKLGGINDGNHRNVLVFEHNDSEADHVIDSFSGSSIETIFGTIGFTEPNLPQ